MMIIIGPRKTVTVNGALPFLIVQREERKTIAGNPVTGGGTRIIHQTQIGIIARIFIHA